MKANVTSATIPQDQVKVPTANTCTYACPYCDRKNFDNKGMVEHIRMFHGQMPGVCPICSAEPWGDKNYICPDLLGHMHLRHRFTYD